MSNHSGSYMLSKVLLLMEERGIFAKIGRKAAQQLMLDIVKLSDRYDCNENEILEDIGERFKICWDCRAVKPVLIDGMCLECRDREGIELEPDEDEEEPES